MNYNKKTFCENITGSPMWGTCKQKKYHASELQMDHKDGNPFNNDPSNLWTICSNCHQRKTDYMGDRLTPGRGGSVLTSSMVAKQKNELIELFTNFNEIRKEIRDEGILTPFIETYDNGLLNILIGATNIGKTWCIYKEMAPYHFNSGGQLHIALSPIKESMNYTELEEYILEADYGKVKVPIIRHSDSHKINFREIEKKLRLGKNVTLIMSDQFFNSKDRPEEVLKLVKKYKTLVTRDEASYGMLTSWEFSKDVTGNVYSEDTKQSFYNNFKDLYDAGAIVFGVTATPNREMKEIIGEDWNIINPDISDLNSRLIPFRKSYESIKCADWGVEDYGDPTVLTSELNSLFTKVTAANIMLDEFDTTYVNGKFHKQKITGMIVAQPDQGNGDKILQSDIVDALKSGECDMPSHQTMLVINAHGWEEFDSNGNLLEEGKHNEFQDKLNDPHEPAHYVVVINRAVYGVNINTLGFGLLFRKYGNQTGDTKEYITLSAEQLIGRFNRLNIDINKILYILKTHGPDVFRQYMELVGRFTIKAPKNKHIETAFENFKSTHGTSWESALSFYFNY